MKYLWTALFLSLVLGSHVERTILKMLRYHPLTMKPPLVDRLEVGGEEPPLVGHLPTTSWALTSLPLKSNTAHGVQQRAGNPAKMLADQGNTCKRPWVKEGEDVVKKFRWEVAK